MKQLSEYRYLSQHRKEKTHPACGAADHTGDASMPRRQATEQWLRENEVAIGVYRRLVEKHGIWNRGVRPW